MHPYTSLTQYVSQFNISRYPYNCIIISMELNLTQTEYRNGSVKYEIHHDCTKNIGSIRTNNEYTNIASTEIDVNKRYRLAFGFSMFALDQCVELLPE